ncbi:hypothetical protein CsSME_00020002 [Camellia sinensis var. sinensis]
MASLINNPLRPLYKSKSKFISNSNSELCPEIRFSNRCGVGFSSLSLDNSGRVCFPIVCKAVSVTPQTQIEGLNIAEDVTQVSHSLLFFTLVHYTIILLLVLVISSNFDCELVSFQLN